MTSDPVAVLPQPAVTIARRRPDGSWVLPFLHPDTAHLFEITWHPWRPHP